MAELFTSLPASPVLRAFVQYLTAFCSRLEAASNVISRTFVRQIGPDKPVKLREIPPEAVGGGIFDSVFNITSDQK